jgi:hypothetical protein
MCSILFDTLKLNRNLISIVREYLIQHENRFNLIDNVEFLEKYYLLQMKKRFPQEEYPIHVSNYYHNSFIKFKIENLEELLRTDPIFTGNQHIFNYIRYNLRNELDFFLSCSV